MAEDTPRKFVTLGMFIIDELVYDGGKITKEQVSDRTPSIKLKFALLERHYV